MSAIHPAAGHRSPRILMVTPQITFLPPEKGCNGMVTGKAGNRADLTVSLASALTEIGADVHVTFPHYRRMFHADVARLVDGETQLGQRLLPMHRVHRAEDRLFYYRAEDAESDQDLDRRVALAFQREVINTILPRVKPDLVHCNDWMCGLIPAAARQMGIPCLFTLHAMHSVGVTLDDIEAAGMAPNGFWSRLYFARMPLAYEETRSSNPADLLTSGIFAADAITTVSPSYLEDICGGRYNFVPAAVRAEVIRKRAAGRAAGVLNVVDASYDPGTDSHIAHWYSAETHREGKSQNKLRAQQCLGLESNPHAPLFFWPSRLDAGHRGCQLLTALLAETVAGFGNDGLQVAIVADGLYQKPLRDIVREHRLERRVAVCDYAEDRWRQGFAGADFTLIPSLYEPCGRLAQIGLLYGALPVARDTGALHDIVAHLDVAHGAGNGFRFENYDANGLRWALGEAMAFHRLPPDVKERQVARVMVESVRAFAPAAAARRYLDLYRTLLGRPAGAD
jgi:starch synthase